MDKASASYTGGQVGLERATIEPKIAGSSPVGGVFFFSFFFSFTLVLKMLHMVFFLEEVLLKKLQFNTKKKKSNQGLGLRHYFYCIPLLVITIQP